MAEILQWKAEGLLPHRCVMVVYAWVVFVGGRAIISAAICK